MCRTMNGELLTNKDHDEMTSWKGHFEQHLNEGEESEQSPDQVDLRDNGIEIDFPSREEI
jgi:hypothetical protein